MTKDPGYFCRSFIGRDLQSNLAVPTLRLAEIELARMIAAGATSAYAIQHGKSDQERELVALCVSNSDRGCRAVDLRRYLHDRDGPEYKRWQDAYRSEQRLLDGRWKVVELCVAGIHEYGAVGKAVLAEDQAHRSTCANV
jgi:hypothetical protein